MITIAMMLAAAAPEVRRPIPVSELDAPDALFTCGERGLPSVTLNYHGVNRYMSYAQFGEDKVIFLLADPVKAVVYEREGERESWLITAEGPARDTEGAVADGTPVALDLAVHSSPTDMTADFTVRAGSFSRTANGCRLMPPRPKPSGTAL